MRCRAPRSFTENQQYGDQNATTVTCPCARSLRRWVSPVLDSKRVGPVSERGADSSRTAARISPFASLTQELHREFANWGAVTARIESPKAEAEPGSAATFA